MVVTNILWFKIGVNPMTVCEVCGLAVRSLGFFNKLIKTNLRLNITW